MAFLLKRNSKTSGKSNEQYSKLQVENLEISIVRKNVRGIRLSIRPDGEIRLSMPISISDSMAKDFVSSKLPWLRLHLERIKERKELEPDDFSTISYLGTTYQTQLIYHRIAPRVVIDSSEKICIFLKPGTPSTVMAKVIHAWYRTELQKLIPPLIQEWEPIMNVKINSVQFKRMKTRWGTCNVIDHRIWFNVELAKKSFPCIEYIVVHEMCHLLERGHGPKFKACMDKYLPDWRNLRKELNNTPVKS
jgi:predicted metal-dependent hydrolase